MQTRNPAGFNGAAVSVIELMDRKWTVDISHIRRRNMEVMTANITTSPDTIVSPDTTARMVCMAVSRQT